MNNPTADQHSAKRRARDEQVAAEPPMAPLPLAADAQPLPIETYLRNYPGHPDAIAGVVENGVVRPLDPAVKLAEYSRVIIVASEK